MVQFFGKGIDALKALAAVGAFIATLGGILYVIAEEKKWSRDTRRDAYYGLFVLLVLLVLVLVVALYRSH